MAIQFLNSIDLNNIPAEGFAVENLATDPSVSQEGSIYYNTGTDKLKVYTGSGWVEIGSGVTSVTTTDGTFIDLTPNTATTGAVTVTAQLSATGTPSSSTYLRGDNTWASIAASQNDFLTGLSFNTADGVLTATVSNQSDVTVDLDGRYALSSSVPTVNNSIITLSAGTYLGGGGDFSLNQSSAETITFNHDSTSRTDTTSTDAPGYGGTFEAVTSVSTNAQGHVTAIDVSTVTIPAAEDYTWSAAADAGGTRIIQSGNTIDFTGGTNINTENAGGETRFHLDDSITLAGELTVSGTGQSSFGGQVTIPTTPSAGTDAASKSYVDASVVGNLVYQGGYNAATNTPDLDSSPSASIKKGWTYTVTADGTFFTEQVRVGDVLIAEQDAPTALANWTTVQNNIDLADLSTVGIGNVNAGTGVGVAYSSGTATVTNTGVTSLSAGAAIDVSASTGGVTVSVEDSTASNKGAVIVAGGTGISVAYNSGTATITNTETNSSNSFAATITASGAVTHSLGTKDVIVQLYDTVTDETVYAEIERNSTSQVTVTFAATPTNSIRVLVQKIG